ncbi:TSUP family transporter (plasmid) [Pseudoalteromonas espejiana]
MALIATGIFAGILAGLFGGGGIVIVLSVLLLQVLGVFRVGHDDSHCHIACHHSAYFASSIRSHHAKGNIDLALIKYWAPFILVMAVVGSY